MIGVQIYAKIFGSMVICVFEITENYSFSINCSANETATFRQRTREVRHTGRKRVR